MKLADLESLFAVCLDEFAFYLTYEYLPFAEGRYTDLLEEYGEYEIDNFRCMNFDCDVQFYVECYEFDS